MIQTIINKIRGRANKIQDVFTPSTSAKLTFVEREEIDKQINKGLLIPGMQLIIYGHSGSGKTTITQNILNKNKIKFIVTNCILDTTINEIILDAFDKLNPYYVSEKSTKDSAKIGADLKASYLALDSTLKTELATEYTEKKQRALPVQLTPQRLAEFLGAAEITWIIEDFHKVKIEERQKLSQILKIFVDTSNKYKKVKIIAIGAVGTAREVVNHDNELNNRIAEIHVPLMTKEELVNIIIKGEKLLNIQFEAKIHSDIIRFSNSLAAICHHICFSICYNNGVLTAQKIKKKFKTQTLEDAVLDYLKQNSDSFKEILDRALKPRDGKLDNTKGILHAFCKSQKDELTQKEILNHRSNKKAYSFNISEYLNLLTTADYGEILRFDENSGKYSFSNPFFKAYAIMHFSTEEKENVNQTLDMAKFQEIMKYLTVSMDNVQIKVERKPLPKQNTNR